MIYVFNDVHGIYFKYCSGITDLKSVSYNS